MHDESKQGGSQIDSYAEHLVVLTVAGVERGRRREQVYRTLGDLDRSRVDDAIARLEAVGLVVVKGRSVHQSSALGVRPEQVVHATDGCLSPDGLMSSSMVIGPQPAVKCSCALGARSVDRPVGPA